MGNLTQAFIEALHHLEETGEVERIAALFAAEAEIANPIVQHESGNPQAATAFWQRYRSGFATIRSEFRNVVEADHVIMLEWVSDGQTAAGPFRYGGVSVIEHESGRVTAFRSYFDPRHITAAPSAMERAQRQAADERQRQGGYQ